MTFIPTKRWVRPLFFASYMYPKTWKITTFVTFYVVFWLLMSCSLCFWCNYRGPTCHIKIRVKSSEISQCLCIIWEFLPIKLWSTCQPLQVIQTIVDFRTLLWPSISQRDEALVLCILHVSSELGWPYVTLYLCFSVPMSCSLPLLMQFQRSHMLHSNSCEFIRESKSSNYCGYSNCSHIQWAKFVNQEG